MRMNLNLILLELILSFRISSIRFALPASSMDNAKSLIWSVSSSVKSIIISCNACCSRTWWFLKYRSLQSLLSVVFGLMSAPRTGYLPICRGIFLKHSRSTNGEGQYVEESKWGFQYVEEYKSSTYWLVFLDLLAKHWICQYIEEN